MFSIRVFLVLTVWFIDKVVYFSPIPSNKPLRNYSESIYSKSGLRKLKEKSAVTILCLFCVTYCRVLREEQML